MPSTLRFLQPGNTLEALWCFFLEPGMDDLAEENQDVLDKMIDDLEIYPFVDRYGDYRLFLGRYEFVKDGESFTYTDAAESDSYGFIDFLAGFPVDCVEMLVGIGEYSTKAEDVDVDEVGEDRVFPLVPTNGQLFRWPDSSKIFLNYTGVTAKDADGVRIARFFAPNLDGEPKPTSPKFWFRVQIRGDGTKYPIPGEFFGLGCRIFPGFYWGHQKSHPFVYAGNWMDTVFYTGAKITVVNEPEESRPYHTYTVKWHKEEIENVVPSDFTIYAVDDRVTIVKDIETTKTSQLWKDDDTETFDVAKWRIVPVMFYDIENRTPES